jgi:uncharacterized protein (DUF362 family)
MVEHNRGEKLKDLHRENCVILESNLNYPKRVPFDPPEYYPELPFEGDLDAGNKVYPAIRKALRLSNLDARNYGAKNWSPLSEFIKKGDTVLIKPNLVYDRNLSGDSIFAVITHPSFVRAIIDYAYKATGDSGKIIVADAPQSDANFQKITEVTGLAELVEYLRNSLSIQLELLDLRKWEFSLKDGVVMRRKALPGDPKGYVSVDLRKTSKLAEIDSEYGKFYGANSNRRETRSFHNSDHHIYIVSRTALESDAIINLPKLKTHMKSGITVAIKNMIGIIGDKNSIVHYRVGPPSKGGDEFPEGETGIKRLLLKFNRSYSDLLLSRGLGIEIYRLLVRLGGGQHRLGSESEESSFVHSGNWYGNDTIWRTVLDVSRISMYADKHGEIHDLPQRKMFTIVDGVIGGEGQGPLAAHAKQCGAIICGNNSLDIDRISARLMGFDEKKVPAIYKVAERIPPKNVRVTLAQDDKVEEIDLDNLPNLHFRPPRTHRSESMDSVPHEMLTAGMTF